MGLGFAIAEWRDIKMLGGIWSGGLERE